MYGRDPNSRTPFGGAGGGLTGPVPRDLVLLLGVVLATYSLQFFAATAGLVRLLQLTPSVWKQGFLWQLATYPFVGLASGGFWFLIELLILYMFGRDVYLRLGRRRFWTLLGSVAAAAALIAVAVDIVAHLSFGASVGLTPFALLQGQRMLVVILVAAFATLMSDATIYLFFVLPVKASWFLPLEILFAFLAFLPTKDLAGFLGICGAVGATWLVLSPGGWDVALARLRLRLRERWLRLRLDWMRRRRGIRLVKDDDPNKDRDRWLH